MNEKKIEEGFQVDKIINGKFVIDAYLGGGGMGLIYLAHYIGNTRWRVVVKTLRKKALDEDYIVTHFHKEAEALGRINHDGVVKIIDHGDDEETGLPFIVMEFAEGKTLTKIIDQEDRMDVKRCADLVRKIAYALNAAHQENVYHRDLKPDNIIVIESEHEPDKIKLIDFGIAKVNESTVGQSTATDVLVGTLEYLSPEQLNYHQTIVGEVFCLATVAYQMLTRKHAFPLWSYKTRGEKITKLHELHKQGAKSPKLLRPDLPDGIDNIFLKGLACNPAQRYESPIEFARALSAVLENKRQLQPPVTYKLPNRWRISRRNLWPLMALICLLGAAAYFFYPNPAAPAGKTLFRNSREGLNSTLNNHFIDLSFEHPNDWIRRRAGKDDFVDVGKFTPTGMPIEQFRVGWYPNKDAFKDSKKLEEIAKKELPKMISGYERTSRGQISYDKFFEGKAAARFRETGRSGKVTVWGQTLFFNDGLRIIMVASSLSPDVTKEEDFAIKGDLPTVFKSFKLLPDKK
jgi:serine/threonine-protein kinase